MHRASSLAPVDDSPECKEYRDAGGATLEIADPLTRAAVLELQAAWPASVQYRTLLEKAAARAGLPADGDNAAQLAWALLMCHTASRGMEVHLFPHCFQTTVSEFPMVPALIRWQATRNNWVTNLRHENLALSPEDRAFLQKVDGTRSVDILALEAGNAREVLAQFGRLALLAG